MPAPPLRSLLPALSTLAALSAACALGPRPPRPWKPVAVTSPAFESHPAFDPLTGDLWFVRSTPTFQGWRLLVCHCTSAGWSKPEEPPFAGDGVEANPHFSPDGRSLWFISTRATGSRRSADLDIWRVDRLPDGTWREPVRLPEPVNSSAAEWFPRLGPDGWLYFGSNRPGGLGGTDIWRARDGGDAGWTVENLRPSVNTAGHEFEAEPAADGSRLILTTGEGLWEVRRTADGFAPRTRVPAGIDANGTEVGPLLSPSGRSLLYARDTEGPDSGELFLWAPGGEEETWPPRCGGERP